MQDTVDQAHSTVHTRTVPHPPGPTFIQDAFRTVCGHCCADSPSMGGVNRYSSSRPVGTGKSAGS